MMDPKFAGKPITTPGPYTLTGRADIDQMQETPNRRAHHRRAQSETFFRFPDFDDDILLDDVVADFNLDLSPTPSADSYTQQQQQQQQEENGPLAQPTRPNNEPSPLAHHRSLSVDADFFAGLDLGADSGATAAPAPALVGQGTRHRHSNSMDGSVMMAASFEGFDSSKKVAGADKLSELALIDPKRAKRILANRQSAARSKERKIRYTNELERKVQTLQNEATTLSAQVTKLQRDTNALTAENKELKLRLQAMEQQAHLRDALHEALREELQHLKIAAGRLQAANGNNTGLHSQFPPQPQTLTNFSGSQRQYLQQQQHQQLPPAHSTAVNTNLSGQPQPSFQGFN